MVLLNFNNNKKNERNYYLKWIFSAFCISISLILLEPFGTTFRNTSAILLAFSYGALSTLTLIILNKYFKHYIYKQLNSLKIVNPILIWYAILLTIIALINFFYFGLWYCHCETKYSFTLFAFQFVPRTFVLGGIIIVTERLLNNFPQHNIYTNFSSTTDIIAISSLGNYLKIKRADEQNSFKETLERGSLKKLIEKDSPDFFRCHRSHVINIHYVKCIVKDGRRYSAILEQGVKIPVSISNVNELKSLIKH